MLHVNPLLCLQAVAAMGCDVPGEFGRRVHGPHQQTCRRLLLLVAGGAAGCLRCRRFAWSLRRTLETSGEKGRDVEGRGSLGGGGTVRRAKPGFWGRQSSDTSAGQKGWQVIVMTWGLR